MEATFSLFSLRAVAFLCTALVVGSCAQEMAIDQAASDSSQTAQAATKPNQEGEDGKPSKKQNKQKSHDASADAIDDAQPSIGDMPEGGSAMIVAGRRAQTGTAAIPNQGDVASEEVAQGAPVPEDTFSGTDSPGSTALPGTEPSTDTQPSPQQDVTPDAGAEPVIEPDPQQCTEGTVLGIWLDPSGDGNVEGDPFLGEIEAYTGAKTAAANYGYVSASAHPVVGPSPIKLASHVFFYEGTDGLALTLFHNIENENEGGNAVQWDIETTGNNGADKVLLTDDPASSGDELKKKSGSTAELGKYAGRWAYSNNTDGGVIGPFSGEDFRIKVKILLIGNVNNAAFYSADGSHFTLKDENDDISSFVIGFKSRKLCTQGN